MRRALSISNSCPLTWCFLWHSSRARFTKKKYSSQYQDTSFSRALASSPEICQTPVRSRPLPFYEVSSSPLPFYASFSCPDTPETVFKDPVHDIFDDDHDDYMVLHRIQYSKSQPRRHRIKNFLQKVLALKTNSELSLSSSGKYSAMELSMNSWDSSTETLSGWTTVSLPSSPSHAPTRMFKEDP